MTIVIGNNNELIAGTFARGIYTYDLAQLENVANDEIVINRIHLYPTVVESQFTIEGLEVGERVEVISSHGEILKSDVIKSAKHIIDISNFPIGQYFVRPSFGKASRVIKI